MRCLKTPRLALTAAAVLLASPLVGQKPPAPAETPRPGPFIRSVDVTITNLDVVVTDSKGNRVKGLTKADFEVIEDGQQQLLTNFYAVDGGKLVFLGDEPVPPEAPAPAEAAPPSPAAAPLPVPKTRIVIFVDNLNLTPFNRNRVLRNVEEWARESIHGNVEAMVVTWDRSLKVKRKFTNDGRDIADVLKQVEEISAPGQARLSERRDALQQIDDAQSEAEAVARVRSYALSYKNDLDFTLDAIKTTVNQLAGVEGRKILLHVSDGLPQSPGAELWKYIQDKFQSSSAASLQQFEFDRTTGFSGIVQAANAAGVTIYAVDASGLSIDSSVTAEARTQKARIDDFVERTNLQSMLSFMSEETGGEAFLNRNNVLPSLKEVEKDFSSYYSLGYRSQRAGADRPHKVVVKVKRKGLTVRARSTYVEKGLETRVQEAVTSALYFARDDNALGVGVEIGEPAPADSQNYFVPVRVRIPYSRITLLPDGPKSRGRLIFYFIVVDSDGKQSDLATQQVPVEVDTDKVDTYARHDFIYDVKMLMIPGGQRLSLAVRDEPTNIVSYVQKSIFVSVLPPEMRPKSGR